MSYSVQDGPSLGMIQVNLGALGVHREDYDALRITVGQLGDLTYLPEERKSFTSKSKPSNIKVYIDQDDFLHAQVDVGQLGEVKRSALIEKMHGTIMDIARHKAEVPGPGSSRRKTRSQSYVNDHRRASVVT